MGDTAYFEKIERSLNTGKQVAVLGAGTMGCGIAAHLANLGYEVRLFDTSLEAATAGLTRATSAKPPHFTTPQSLSRIQLNSIAEDLHKLADCSWVCEAIVEKLEVKKELYSAITPYLNDHAILSTNTSGLEINLLAEPLPDSLRSRFIGIHFFNPPRYLKLIELIQTDSVSPLLTKIVSDFLEHKIGKRVVRAKDTPGFIANRFGMWSMYKAIHVAETLGLTVEEADAITGPFLGRPKSGSFRLSDIVGLDVMQDIASNLQQRCPSDTHTEALAAPRSVEFLLEKGWIGEKAGQGFFRRNGKDILSLDLVTHSYRERIEPTLPALLELGSLPLAERLAQSIRRKDVVGEFMRLYLHPLLSYAQTLAPEICFSYSDFDRVMEWGFGWQAGPFKMIDMIGVESFGTADSYYFSGLQKSVQSNELVPVDAPEAFRQLTDYPIVETHNTFEVRDLGDDVLLIANKAKMGVVKPAFVEELYHYLTDKPNGRFVLTSTGSSFSAGFDLSFFNSAILAGDLPGIDLALDQFHKLGELLEQRMIVAAICGYCLGGGLETAMACPRIVASLETKIGLPEAKVGLIPGGRGNAVMRLRSQDSAQSIVSAVINLATGTVTTNADEARALGYLRNSDVTAYNADSLIWTAKQQALNLTDRDLNPSIKQDWASVTGPVVGMIDRALGELKAKGELSDYDIVIGDHLKTIFAKTLSYTDALHQERVLFGELCRQGLTGARIKHMLEFSKPLRN